MALPNNLWMISMWYCAFRASIRIRLIWSDLCEWCMYSEKSRCPYHAMHTHYRSTYTLYSIWRPFLFIRCTRAKYENSIRMLICVCMRVCLYLCMSIFVCNAWRFSIEMSNRLFTTDAVSSEWFLIKWNIFAGIFRWWYAEHNMWPVPFADGVLVSVQANVQNGRHQA